MTGKGAKGGGRKGRGRLERRRRWDFAGVNSFRRENISGLINSMVHEIDVQFTMKIGKYWPNKY